MKQPICSLLLAGVLVSPALAADKPNIVFIICDDLGYGDVGCLNPERGKIPTPGADALARQGMIFTDAHSGSSVCTPTRYGVMTGRYSWRTHLQKGVVQGFSPSLIDEDRPTVAGFLKAHGYHTAVIGKWHLNFQYVDPLTGQAYEKKVVEKPPVGAKIPDGPVHRGFDYYHGFHHARDMEAVIENDRVIEHDEVINMLPRLTAKSVEYIHSRAGKNQPFFLYLPLGSPHTPIVPTPEWEGKSGLGDYGDFVMQTDNVIAEVDQALQQHGMTDNTLLIFTSDNGCSKAAGIPQLAQQGHFVSAHMRGSKADLWDGGHRIPFIVRWPGKVQPGSTCDQLICLTDLLATAAEILGEDLPEGSCEDSVSFLPALYGRPIQSTRAGVIHHSISGHFAYRTGDWKLLLARGSGGWTSPKENEVPADAPSAQLYHLGNDPGEQTNLYAREPEIAERLLAQLTADITRGRSTQGAESKNDIDEIVLWKSDGPKAQRDRKPNPPATRKSKKKQPVDLPAFQPDQSRLPVAPPKGALVLFDGSQRVEFVSMQGTEIDWPINDSSLVSTKGSRRSNHLCSTWHFRDADIHVEFNLPAKGSGNSGIYIHGNYELQIFRPSDHDQSSDGGIGAIYGFHKPLANAGREPGQWQVYDIRYRAPRRNEAGELIEEGSITAWLNGQRVQEGAQVGEPRSDYHPYRYGTTPYLQEIWKRQKKTMTGPVFLQDHDSPVRFRNVWIRPLDDQAFRYEP